MRNSILLIASAVLFSLLTSNRMNATGVKVSITLHTGREITGELLVVTDSVLVISRSVGLTYDKLKADTAGIMTVTKDEIKTLIICGKSYVVDGLLLGGIFGMGVGTLLSYEPQGAEANNSNFDPLGAGSGAILIGMAGGMALGAFVGVTSTTSDKEMNIEGRKHIAFLNEYSRFYDRSLPDFLQKYVSPKLNAHEN